MILVASDGGDVSVILVLMVTGHCYGVICAGFVGYVSEFTAMYIWDQCFMFGGRATDWRKILPVICFTLIKVSALESML